MTNPSVANPLSQTFARYEWIVIFFACAVFLTGIISTGAQHRRIRVSDLFRYATAGAILA
jgi:hypothetical protein